MNYTEAKAKHDELEKAVVTTGEAMRAFPRNAMGLVSDAVRLSPEYRTARARSQTAFEALRKFNAVFVKTFAKELRAERAAKREYISVLTKT